MEIPFDKLCKFFKCYDTDVKRLFLAETARHNLTKVGLHSKKRGIVSYLKMLPIIAFYHCLCIGQVGHLVKYLQSNTYAFFDVADDIAVIFSTETITYMFVSVVPHAADIDVMCRSLGNFADRDLGRVPGVEALDKLFAKFFYATVYFYVACTFFTWVFYFMEHCEPGEVSVCGFVFQPYLPYIDVYNRPWRQIWLIVQCLCANVAFCVGILTVAQYIFVQEVIILHADHLGNIIRQIPKTQPRQRRAVIGRVVRYHDFLLGTNKLYNAIAGKVYGLHLFVTPVNMSVIVYQLMGREIMLTSVLHLFIYVIIVTLTCGSGERLSTFTEKLHHVVYESIPFDDVTSAKMMQLILLRAKQPFEIRASGVVACNHILMIQLYKAVWSTLTLLNGTK